LNSLKITAIKILQKDITLYVSTFLARDLAKIVKIDTWSEDNVGGYQRSLSESRVAKAVKYLTGEEGSFPGTVVLNARGSLDFTPSNKLNGHSELGVLSIPRSSFPLWIIDGQHRLMAIMLAATKSQSFLSYSVPVCILNLSSRFDEMRMFFIVNSRQKSVSTDLVQRHLYQTIAQKGEWRVSPYETEARILQAEALPIVDILRCRKDSVWFDRVQLPGEPRDDRHIIRQTSFADSIAQILKTMTPAERDEIRHEPSNLSDLLVDYWNAIKEVFSDAFDDPQSFLIQKTCGCYVFHLIFPQIRRMCIEADDLSKKMMKSFLLEIFRAFADAEGVEVDSTFWHRIQGHPYVMGTSQKTFRSLASRFLGYLVLPSE